MPHAFSPVPTPGVETHREPNEDETSFVQKTVPSIGNFQVIPHDSPFGPFRYNCIGWSLGMDDQWIEPAKTWTGMTELCTCLFSHPAPGISFCSLKVAVDNKH